MRKCLFWDECSLKETALNPYISYTGAKKPQILFVGEAPGKEEDIQGVNFVGDSGKLLRRTIEKLGIQKEFVAFSNVVKCRPVDSQKKNRTPTVREINRCKAHVFAEVEVLKPKIVVLLGSVPLRAFLGDGNITSMRGVPTEKDGILYLPTFHPSAILRNNTLLKYFEQDLSKISELLNADTLNNDLGNYEFCDSLEKVEQLCNKLLSSDEFSFDTETSSKRRDVGNYVVCVSFATKEREGYVVPIRNNLDGYFFKRDTVKVVEFLHNVFSSNSVKSAFNAKFDIQFLRKDFGIEVKNLQWDVMLLHYVLYPELPHDLNYCVLQYTNMGKYWEGLEKWKAENRKLFNNSYANIPWDVLVPYSAADADATLRVKNFLLKKLEGWNETKYTTF